jgi:hypothetical protein
MSLGDALKSLVDLVKNDALKAALPPLAAFFTDVANNPSAVNVAVELAKLQVNLLAALPAVEKDVLTNIATMINNQLATATAPAAAH